MLFETKKKVIEQNNEKETILLITYTVQIQKGLVNNTSVQMADRPAMKMPTKSALNPLLAPLFFVVVVDLELGDFKLLVLLSPQAHKLKTSNAHTKKPSLGSIAHVPAGWNSAVMLEEMGGGNNSGKLMA